LKFKDKKDLFHKSIKKKLNKLIIYIYIYINLYFYSTKMTTQLEDKSIWEGADDLEDLGAEILRSSTDDIINRTKLLENDIKVIIKYNLLTH